MIIEYDKSPRISPEQRIQSLADSVMRAFEELESGKNITEPKPITLEDLGAYPKTGGAIEGNLSVLGNSVTLFGEAEEEGFVVEGGKPAKFTGNMFFKNNGNYIAGITKDGKILGMFTPVNANDECVVGYGGYANSIGGTWIYGNNVNFTSRNGFKFNGANLADHIVEYGTNSSWIYRKWASGYIEAYRYVTATSLTSTGVILNWYYKNVDYSLPDGMFSVVNFASVNGMWGTGLSDATITNWTAPTIRVLFTSNQSSGNMFGCIYAFGHI